jgi:hypothetical protein
LPQKNSVPPRATVSRTISAARSSAGPISAAVRRAVSASSRSPAASRSLAADPLGVVGVMGVGLPGW